jgi:hypothetical protein
MSDEKRGGMVRLSRWGSPAKVAPPAPEIAGEHPLIVLAAPRSFSSVTSAMLGQHPQLYGIPEVHLFVVETVGELLTYHQLAGRRRQDGIMRAIAELYLGGQNVRSVAAAKRWLTEHADASTAAVFEKLVSRAAPRRLVEKSVSTVWKIDSLERAERFFPRARYLHITRHPRGQCESMMETVQREWRIGHQIRDPETGVLDPQILWLGLNSNIHRFLAGIPEERKRRVRGEEVVANPEAALVEIAAWLDIRTDTEAIEEMKHPERSPFSKVGPPNAPFGADPKFLSDPKLRPARVKPQSLEGPVSWRDDIPGFKDEVKALAKEFGYV